MKESLRLSSVNIHHSLQTCFNFHYLLTIKTTCSLRSPFCPALNTKYCQIGEPVFWLLFKSHFRTERDRFCDIYLPDHPPPAPGNIFGGEMCNILTIWSQTDWSAVPARPWFGFPSEGKQIIRHSCESLRSDIRDTCSQASGFQLVHLNATRLRCSPPRRNVCLLPPKPSLWLPVCLSIIANRPKPQSESLHSFRRG